MFHLELTFLILLFRIDRQGPKDPASAFFGEARRHPGAPAQEGFDQDVVIHEKVGVMWNVIMPSWVLRSVAIVVLFEGGPECHVLPRASNPSEGED